MSERKGTLTCVFADTGVCLSIPSFEQVLPPGLRPISHPSTEAAKEFAAGRSLNGPLFYVRVFSCTEIPAHSMSSLM